MNLFQKTINRCKRNTLSVKNTTLRSVLFIIDVHTPQLRDRYASIVFATLNDVQESPIYSVSSEHLVEYENSLARKRLSNLVGVDYNTKKMMEQTIVSKYKIFCQKDEISFQETFDYLLGILDHQKHETIRTFFRNKYKKAFSDEDLVFIFSNDLEDSHLSDRHSFITLARQMVQDGCPLELITDSSTDDISVSVYRGASKQQQSDDDHTSENGNTDLSYASFRLSHRDKLEDTFGKDDVEYLLDRFSEELRILDTFVKIGNKLTTDELKQEFIAHISKRTDLRRLELENIYRVLDFFNLHNMFPCHVLERLLEIKIKVKKYDGGEDSMNYLFRKLKPNKLPERFFITDFDSFENMVFDFLQSGNKNIVIDYLGISGPIDEGPQQRDVIETRKRNKIPPRKECEIDRVEWLVESLSEVNPEVGDLMQQVRDKNIGSFDLDEWIGTYDYQTELSHFTMSRSHSNLIEGIVNNRNRIITTFLERCMIEVLQSYIQDHKNIEDFALFTSSDFDDIVFGFDAVLICKDNQCGKYALYIDFCITDSPNTVKKKKVSFAGFQPGGSEFSSIYGNYDSSGCVVDFSPEAMAHFIVEYSKSRFDLDDVYQTYQDISTVTKASHHPFHDIDLLLPQPIYNELYG